MTTLTVTESLLGDDVISIFRQVQNDAVVDLSLLPSIHVYVLWKHLHQLVVRDSVHPQQLDLQNVLMLVPEVPEAAVLQPQTSSNICIVEDPLHARVTESDVQEQSMITATAEVQEQSVTATAEVQSVTATVTESRVSVQMFTLMYRTVLHLQN